MSSIKKKSWVNAFITVVLLAAAYYLYQNNYLVAKTYDYYVYFDDVYGVQKSTPVYLHGVKIGRVSNIEFEGGDKVKVTLSIKKTVKIKDSSVAQIAGEGLAGGRMIKMREGNSDKVLPRQSSVIPELDTTFILMASQIDPMIATAQYNIRSFDSSVRNINRQIEEGVLIDIATSLSSFNKDMKQYAVSFYQFRKSIDTTLVSIQNFEKSSAEIVTNIDKTNKSIQNAVQQTSKYTKPTLQSDLATIKSSFSKVAKTVKGITNKDTGALGPLLHTPNTYNTATQQIEQAKEAVNDIQANPPTISIIGN